MSNFVYLEKQSVFRVPTEYQKSDFLASDAGDSNVSACLKAIQKRQKCKLCEMNEIRKLSTST